MLHCTHCFAELPSTAADQTWVECPDCGFDMDLVLLREQKPSAWVTPAN